VTPEDEENVFKEQALQTVRPVLAPKLPTEQREHSLDSRDELYRPALQLEHAEAPDAEYEPASHEVPVLRPVDAHLKPEGHVKQLLAPSRL